MARHLQNFGRTVGLVMAAGVVLAVVAAPFLMHVRKLKAQPQPDTYQAPARYPVAAADAHAQYAGSASCRDCHPEAYAQWRTSTHAMAERVPEAVHDDAAFVPPRRFAHGSQETAVAGSNGAYRIAATGLTRQVETAGVVRLIGHDPLRQYLVPAPGGRLQTHEASFDPHRGEWFNVYGEEDRQPGEWGHWTGRGMNWNNMCAACHNTRVRKQYDPVQDRYDTTMAELTVSCEACHGPLKAHVDWRRAHAGTTAPDPTVPVMSPLQQFETCATCHSRRMELTGDFVPGDRFDDHYRLTLVDATDLYYPDGQVRDENYEVAALLGSRMGAAGVRCADCHLSHSTRLLLPGNLVCMRCHGEGGATNAPVIDPLHHGKHALDPAYGITNQAQALALARMGTPPHAMNPGFPDVAALAARDREAVWASGGECVNCHMPQTYYMQRHRRHDHGMTIPDPLLSRELGIPNACNRCHTDKDVDWAVTWTDRWYGARMDRPERQRTRIVAAARNGDPGAWEGLLTLLATESNVYWQAVAAGLLAPWAQEPAVAAALAGAMQHSDARVRAEAAAAGPAGPIRQRLLEDPVKVVRYTAAWAQRDRLEPGSASDLELRALLDLVSDQPVGQMQKGAYHLARGEVEQAAVHYRKAVEWDAHSAGIRHDLAVVLSMQGLSADAVRELEAACRLEPRNGEFRYKLGLAWAEAGRIDRALTELAATVALDPAHGRAWFNLGLAHAAEERWPAAIEALTQAVSLSDAPDVTYALATVYARAGDVPAARAALELTLRRDPTHVPAQQMRFQLRAAPE